jgi:hypothetical protein
MKINLLDPRHVEALVLKIPGAVNSLV